jgi:hypothetical protein
VGICVFNIGGCMKYCKHYLLFALAGALLLLPVTSHYAISWEDIKKRARTFVSEDSTKIMPGAVLVAGLAAGGLYYWWMNNRNSSIEKHGVRLKQFEVYYQFYSGGGGAASCGYHTLLRGMQIVAAKSRNENDENLQKTLKSSDLIDQYFGKNGTWRQAIIQRKPDDDRRGDWIDDGDLEYLWKNYRNDILNQEINCGFFAMPNFSLIGTEYSELEPYIKDEVRPFLNQLREMFYIFALGTMDQIGDVGRTEGHWYPLVMHQNSEGKRQYYITDSGSWNKTNRLEDVNASKLINLIEQ